MQWVSFILALPFYLLLAVVWPIVAIVVSLLASIGPKYRD